MEPALFAKALAIAALLPLAGAQSLSIQPPRPAPIHPWAEACKDWDDWDKAGPPFKVYGNTWYVGTCGISALLITGPRGHVLIDTGTEQGAEVVLANVTRLGFKPRDIKILLSSHEHFDHVGGMAKLQAATGAKVLASPVAALVLRTGKDSADDPQSGMHKPMRPVPKVSLVRDGQPVRVGPLAITPIFTPGHTPGATSWQWQSCEGGHCKTIVYADSLSAVSRDGYRFSDHPEYLAAFKQSAARVEALGCDVLLTPHPSASTMRNLLLARDLAAPGLRPCEWYGRSIRGNLLVRLIKENPPK
jgi:metallo-beta-lactamase class B